MLKELLAGFGQVGLLADPLHQRDVEAALELLHLMGDRGLREIELLRRSGDAAALDHFDKSPELIEVEAAHALIEPLAILAL